MAVLREYSANAWDANRMAGKANVPIKVTLPTAADPELKIRDYGDGLSLDDVLQVYTQYGASTKRGDNSAVGMLGIGSKSGFAYSDSFTVTSWHAGFKSVYVAVIDKSNKGRMDLFYSEKSDEESGVEIQIAVKKTDIYAFEERAKKLFMHFEPRPVINCTLEPPVKYIKVGTLGAMEDSSADYYSMGTWTAVMGCVPYRIDLDQLGGSPADAHRIGPAVSRTNGIAYFGIGELEVAASREDLKYGDSTRVAIAKRINEIIDEFVRQMLDGIDKLSNWEQRIKLFAVSRKQLPIPSKFKDMDSGYVQISGHIPKKKITTGLTPTDVDCFSVDIKNYRDKLSGASSIPVDATTQFIIRDEYKAIAGYSKLGRKTDVVIKPHDSTPKGVIACQRDLNKMIKDLKIDGIKTIMISTLGWVNPRGPGKPRDALMAKSRAFILHPEKEFLDDRRSKYWKPNLRTPLGTDVFIVLHGYRDSSGREFYQKYLDDARKLESVGLKMPDIYGYKSTAAKPITEADCKGTSYFEWRKKGLPELLLTSPLIADLIKALSFQQACGYASSMPNLTRIKKQLGDQHPVYIFCQGEVSSKSLLAKTDYKVQQAAEFVRSLAPSDWTVTGLDSIYNTYPLLGKYHMDVFRDVDCDMWIDYVKLVDRNRDTTKMFDLKVTSKEMTA